MYFIAIVGPAGSGKTQLTSAFADWLKSHELDVAVINLDPAVGYIPYSPDIDVRDYVTTQEVMKKYNLGPNGALLVSIDLLVNYIKEIRREIDNMKPNYVLIDTPGQLEVFAYRKSGYVILQGIVGDNKAVSVFLIDSYFASQPSSLASMLLLALSTSIRLKLPQIITVSKSDLLARDHMDRIVQWLEDPGFMVSDMLKEKDIVIPEELIYEIPRIGVSAAGDVLFTSSITWEGMDELYASIQRILVGGEDYLTEEPSGRL
mgnify:CR=1 FL=1